MISLPIEQPWYRKIIAFSAIIGLVGGIGALLYTVITGIPISFLFGSGTAEYWSGEWWWIPLVATGGLLVVWLRQTWEIPERLPNAIELAKEAIIDRSSALKLVIISVVSLIFGASLGPSYGIVMLGGAFGSWLFSRREPSDEEEIEREYTRTGMAGSLGAVFSDPLLGTLFTLEKSPSKKDQLASSLPRLIAAMLGYLVFFGATGSTLLNAFQLPNYEYTTVHLLYGALLGVIALVVLFVFVVVGGIAQKLMSSIGNLYLRGVLGGALVGLIAFWIPLTAGSGNGQLAYLTTDYAALTISFGIIVLVAKIVAVAVSQNSGFLGGNVFPILFIGGIAGFTMHVIFPAIPVALAVSALLAAVPGATLSAPLSIILIAAATVGLGIEGLPPIIIAVIVAQLGVVSIQLILKRRAKNTMERKDSEGTKDGGSSG